MAGHSPNSLGASHLSARSDSGQASPAALSSPLTLTCCSLPKVWKDLFGLSLAFCCRSSPTYLSTDGTMLNMKMTTMRSLWRLNCCTCSASRRRERTKVKACSFPSGGDQAARCCSAMHCLSGSEFRLHVWNEREGLECLGEYRLLMQMETGRQQRRGRGLWPKSSSQFRGPYGKTFARQSALPVWDCIKALCLLKMVSMCI